MELPDGLYDKLLTETVWNAVTRTTDEHACSLKSLTVEEAPERLADALAAQLSRILDDLHGDGAEKLRQQLDLVNFLLVSLKQRLGKRAGDAETLSAPPQILQAIHQQSPRPAIPETGLALPWLFTAGKGSPSLLTDCDANWRPAIRTSGELHHAFRRTQAPRILQSITSVGPDGVARLRVLTITYTGATEIRAGRTRPLPGGSACLWTAVARGCMPGSASAAAPASAPPMWAAPTCRARL